MNSFDQIKKQIAKDIEARNAQEPTAVAAKVAPTMDPVTGMPKLTPKVIMGTIVSKTGTEKVTLDASTFQFMECTSATHNKTRYCVVEKNTPALYGNQYINAAGERTHILTRELYHLMFGVIGSASKQIRQLSTDLTRASETRDLYKMTIDALRKNGVID